MKSISEKIRELRKNQKLTQEALGAKLGISGQAVAKWEKGESLPDILLLPDLCKILDTTADQLLQIEKPKKAIGKLLKVEDQKGMRFQLKGKRYRDESLKLSYADVIKHLSILTDEATFRVLMAIPVDEGALSQEEICTSTGLTDAEVRKALRILQKREYIREADTNSVDIEPKYQQSPTGAAGIYMILAGLRVDGCSFVGEKKPQLLISSTNETSTTTLLITDEANLLATSPNPETVTVNFIDD